MGRPKGQGNRVQAVLDEEQYKKLRKIMSENNLESEPQAVRLIIKYFDVNMLKNRNKHLNSIEE